MNSYDVCVSGTSMTTAIAISKCFVLASDARNSLGTFPLDDIAPSSEAVPNVHAEETTY